MTDRLEVKPSLIEGAGRGLFAKKKIPKGVQVCEYSGRIVSKKIMQTTYLKNPEVFRRVFNPVTRDLDVDNVIIGSFDDDKSGVFVNDSVRLTVATRKAVRTYKKQSNEAANVVPVVIDGKIFYWSTRKINKGEEIYASYGPGYWLMDLGVDPLKIKLFL